MSGRIIPTISGKVREFPGIGPLPTSTFWPFMVALRTVVAPVGESFSYCITMSV